MSNLVKFADALPKKQMDKKEVLNILGGEEYLPYISLHSNDGRFSDQGIPGGVFVLVKNKAPHSLGDTIDLAVLDWRWMAVKYNENGQEREYDPNSDRFDEWRTKANNKVKEVDGSEYWWGMDFLMYDYGSEEFASFYCQNKTLRRAAKEQLLDYTQKIVTLKTRRIESKGNRWWGVECFDCNVDHVDPPIEDIKQWVHKFNNPEAPQGAEEAEETDQEDR